MKLIYALDLHLEGVDDTVVAAADWARRFGAQLDLLFVDGFEQSAHLIQDPEVREVVVAQWVGVQASHRKELDRLLALVPDGQRGMALYRDGHVQSVVTDTAKDYDMLVVATHGRTGLAHVFLGSVAEWLVRHFAGPLLVLRAPEASAKSS